MFFLASKIGCPSDSLRYQVEVGFVIGLQVLYHVIKTQTFLGKTMMIGVTVCFDTSYPIKLKPDA